MYQSMYVQVRRNRCEKTEVAGPMVKPAGTAAAASIQAHQGSRMTRILTCNHVCLRPQVCVILSGRYSGRKAVILKTSDEGTKARPYPHAIVAGVDSYPRKVTKRMGAKKLAKRSKVKPFLKVSCRRSGSVVPASRQFGRATWRNPQTTTACQCCCAVGLARLRWPDMEQGRTYVLTHLRNARFARTGRQLQPLHAHPLRTRT